MLLQALQRLLQRAAHAIALLGFYASRGLAAPTLRQVLLQRRFFRAQLQNVVHETLRSHVFLIRRHRTAHHVLHHVLHQRHPVVVLLRARLLHVELLQRSQREVEVHLAISQHTTIQYGVRGRNGRVLHRLQGARGAQQRADLVSGEITVLHLEKNRVEGKRLDCRPEKTTIR